MRAGLSGGKNVAESVRTHPRLFVTLTAPSFGPVHNRPTGGGKPRPCRCGQHHSEDAAVLGTPLNPRAYDYAGAVLWNAHAGALWSRFTTYVRRELAQHLRMTQKALNVSVRVSFAKVAEYQKRGLAHFHAVVRLDGPDGHTSPPPAFATAKALTEVVHRARDRVVLTLNSDAVGDRIIRWGAEIDVREITALGDGELTDQRVASYVAKYATKSAEGSGTVDRSLVCAPCSGRGMVGDRVRDLCPHCGGTGRAASFADLRVQTHVRTMIRTAWTLGGMPEFAHLKLTKWAHMLGFRGHFSTKSRAYSTTLAHCATYAEGGASPKLKPPANAQDTRPRPLTRSSSPNPPGPSSPPATAPAKNSSPTRHATKSTALARTRNESRPKGRCGRDARRRGICTVHLLRRRCGRAAHRRMGCRQGHCMKAIGLVRLSRP
ncbi:replication initiator [Streptomyces sp. ISL-66]|uniref:replication initiator n=1 Tax=Streptomyces sp. ISL-66 TaxID=2819186 RepID=UPI0035B352E8